MARLTKKSVLKTTDLYVLYPLKKLIRFDLFKENEMFTNNHKKLIKSLHQKKYRDLHGLFLVEGKKCVNELLESDYEIEFLLALQSQTTDYPEITVISEKEMSAISALKTAPGILAVAKKKPSSGTIAGNKILLLDNLKDPGNLGTIIRSAEWFGISDIILNSECVEEFNPKVIQSTMGSIFRMNIERCSLPEKISDLKERGIQIYGADMEGEFLNEVSWTDKIGLVIGSESHGISSQVSALLDKKITIQGRGQAESLNAAVATSIIISRW